MPKQQNKIVVLKPPLENEKIVKRRLSKKEKEEKKIKRKMNKEKSQSNNITNYFKSENTSNSSITSVITETQKNRQNVTQKEVPNLVPILSSKDADMKGGDSDISDNLSMNAYNKVVLAPARITTDIHITENSNHTQNSVSCDVSEIKKTFTSKHLGGQNDSNPGKT